MQFGAGIYTHAGTYNDTAIYAGVCNSKLTTLLLTINPLPVVSWSQHCDLPVTGGCFYTASVAGGCANCDSRTWALNGARINTPINDSLIFAIDGGGGLPGTVIVEPHNFGPDVICLTGYKNGCSFTTCDTVNLFYEGITTINPNKLFTLYPNPADDYVMIDFDASYTGATVFVKDITGRQLFQTQLTASPQQIATGNLPPGVYLVTLFSNGEVGARLLVKE